MKSRGLTGTGRGRAADAVGEPGGDVVGRRVGHAVVYRRVHGQIVGVDRTRIQAVVDGVTGCARLLHELVGERLWDDLIVGSLDDEQRRAGRPVAGGVLVQERVQRGDVAWFVREHAVGGAVERTEGPLLQPAATNTTVTGSVNRRVRTITNRTDRGEVANVSR